MSTTLEGFRLSPVQRRLWRQRRQAGGPFTQAGFELTGALEPAALRGALERQVERHEILRTVFPRLAGMDFPLQVIRDQAELAWRQIDAPATDGGVDLEALFAREREEPFDTDRGPLLRGLLLRRRSDHHLVVLTASALIADGHSLPWLLEEALAEMAAEGLRRAAAETGEEAHEPVQFVDFAEWQNELGESEEGEEGRAFWSTTGLRLLPCLHLPAVADGVALDGGAPVGMVLQEPVAGKAGGSPWAASRSGLSAAPALLAALALLLGRRAGQSAFTLGFGFDGRRLEPLERAPGPYASVLPVALRLQPGRTFRQLAAGVEDELRAAAGWQEYFPWHDDAGRGEDGDSSRPESEGDETPLRPSVVLEFFTGGSQGRVGALGWRLLSRRVDPGSLALQVTARRDAPGLAVELRGDPRRWPGLELRALGRQLAGLWRRLLADPDAPLGSHSLLESPDRHRLLVEFNDTATATGGESGWAVGLAGQTAATPHRTALIAGAEHLTYAGLARQAAAIAAALADLGVGPESRVGLLLERSAAQVVAAMGILQAGGAYVPLDPFQPPRRLGRMLDPLDGTVVTSRAWRHRLEGRHLAALCVEELPALGSGTAPSGRPAEAVNLAYVLFTSGTTGAPKAVAVEQRSVLNLAHALAGSVYAGLETPLRVSLNAPLNFDASVKQLVQLLAGHTLVLVPEEMRADGAALAAFLAAIAVDVLDVTPSQLRLLLAEGELPFSARRVLVGGEEVDPALWDRLARSATRCVNLYGPTECTVDATICSIAGEDGRPGLGRPLANVEVLVTDPLLHPSPAGLPGELAIGGAGVARGYDGLPGATAERFVPEPSGRRPGERLYRTGDRVRFAPDGRLEFLGRLDHQVKLRGNRVELGEIEAALGAHPGVRAAAVAVRPGAGGDLRLIGYVVPRGAGPLGSLPAAAGSDGGYPLPNGWRVAHLDRMETDYVYREIFEQECYLRGGIQLPPGACIVDVGAHVGLFTLFVQQRVPGARVYAFEPIPDTFACLAANAAPFGEAVRVFPYGLSDREGAAEFAFYPRFAARSGLAAYADPAQEAEVVRRFLENERRRGTAGADELLEVLDELLAGRLEPQPVEGQLRRLGNVLREEGVERVDLLKIDAQGSELDVLRGLDDQDWPKIRQIAMEVHDAPGGATEGRVETVLELLRRHGFEAVAEQDELLTGTDRYNLFAVRCGAQVESGSETTATGELYRLPNGLVIEHHNRNETDFIYRQIFEDRVYLQHGLRIEPGSVVFDVGANVGLFTLFAARQARDVEVYAFEPLPASFHKLRRNVERQGLGAHLLPVGLSSRTGEATFTFYPRWSAASGAYADGAQDHEAARLFLLNRDPELARYADEILQDRFTGEEVTCRLTTLSQVIEEHGVERIDLLKIDAEKSEMDVLDGLAEGDWEKVQQAVVEVHDQDRRLERMRERFTSRGFTVVVEQDELARGTGIYSLYARRQSAGQRPAASPPPADGEPLAEELRLEELRSFLRERLPDYMLPGELVVLDALPYTRSGKVDRAALPPPGEGALAEGELAPPRNPFEEVLADLWSEVLDRPAVGVDQSFFELGGHSLLATQLISRVRSSFGVDLPLRSLFDHPTVEAMAREVERALGAGEGPGLPPIEATPRQKDPPLSFAQQRLWFFEQLLGPSGLYNCPHPVRVTGSLDLAVLERCIRHLVARHEVLRTRISDDGGQPRQRVVGYLHVPVPVVDLRRLTAADRTRRGRELALEEAERPFDLGRDPVLRLAVLRLAPEESIVLFTMHHIASDGGSMEILVREVGALYRALTAAPERPAAGASPLPELPVQYADYAEWQRRVLGGEALEAELGWWRHQMAGAPQALELPVDRPRSSLAATAQGRFAGAVATARLPRPVAERLQQLGRRQNATSFMTLLAVFAVLLGRVTGQRDLPVGTPVSGRSRAEVEPLIGFFVNTLVLRLRTGGDPTFRRLVHRVREVALGAFAHAEVPFELLVEELVSGRSLSHSPLFQVMFVFQEERPRTLSVPGLRLEPLELPRKSAKFDLSLAVSDFGDGLGLALEYSTALFDATTAQRLLAAYRRLLVGVAEDGGDERRVEELPLLAAVERQQVLVEWNDTAPPRRPAPALASRVAEVGQARSDAPAVVWDHEHWSYGHLLARAEGVRRGLAGLASDGESRVGVFLPRSPELVAALVGVLAAGACYVPLDLDYPQERLSWMAEDSGVAAVVTSRSQVVRFPVPGVPLLAVEDLPPPSGRRPAARWRTGAVGSRLAYVTYTSGSTGRPKGIAIPQQAVLRLVCGTRYVELGAGLRIGQASTVTFDAATFELWGALVHGGTVVGLAQEQTLSPAGLGRALARQRVQTLFLTTALFNHVARQVPAAFAELRDLLFGGEAVEPRWVRRVLDAGGPRRLLHVYGPTESTTFATWHRVRGPEDGARTVPIGRGVADTRVAILDGGGRPLAVGVPGELALGGPGLARGYWRQPRATAVAFVPDSVFSGRGERLYRTGDRVRWRAAGELEFLGRFDDQVKVRGFRIEPGEVEAVLREHPSLSEVAVAVWEPAPGDPRLVAYFAQPEPPVSTAELEDFARGKLPPFMVPGHWVPLPELPLAPGGKVDRRGLPDPLAAGAPVPGTEVEGPRTPAEELLCDLFARVLEVPSVGRDEDFFRRGGHSLLATRVVSRIRQAFGVELPLSRLFQHPTPAALAREIGLLSGGAAAPPQPIPPLPREGGLPTADVPLSYAQEQLWFLHQMQPESPAYNMPNQVTLHGRVELSALDRALGEIVRRHEVLRTTFVTAEGEPRQRVHPPAAVPLPVVDLRRLPAQRRRVEAERVAVAEAWRPFDLERGPVVRLLCLWQDAEEIRLLSTLHHIAGDAWSLRVLAGELQQLYAAFAAGRTSPLPPLPIQYADVAAWQRRTFTGDSLEAHLAWWREALEGAPEVLDLPTDRLRPPVQGYPGASRRLELGGALTGRLRRLGTDHGCTLFMTLLAGLGALLARWSGQRDLPVGTPVAGRDRLETEGLIGFFVNTLVLRLRLAGEPSFSDLLARVRERTLGAFAHQEVPFELLVEHLRPRRSLSHTPLFQVFFAFDQGPAQDPLALRPSDASVCELAGGAGVVKFDLTVALSHLGGELVGSIVYNTDLFDATTMARFAAHLECLLAAAADEPERPLAALPWLTSGERHQLVREWNEAVLHRAGEGAAFRLFERQVRRRPSQVAVWSAGEGLTYGELNRRSNRLAHHLRRRGVGREALVGIAAGRSPAMAVAQLAVLKAGAAYLPLDPAQPAERLRLLLDDAPVVSLLVQRELLDRLGTALQEDRLGSRLQAVGAELASAREGASPSPTSHHPPKTRASLRAQPVSSGEVAGVTPILCLEDLFPPGEAASPPPLADEPEDDPAVRLDGANLAAILYTSGSTGRPKGVALTHGGIAALVASARELFRRDDVSGFLSTTSLFYSCSLFELFVPLSLGGSILLAASALELPEEDGAPPITLINIVPSAMAEVLRRQELPASVTTVNLQGELPPVELVRALYRRGHVRRVFNGYGATEVTTYATCHALERDFAGAPSIGRPMLGTSIHLLDRRLRPVSVGMTGEVVMGGTGLARGYQRRGALTAAKFVPDPFAGAPGERLYRTGDLARFLPDGRVEILGRMDHQVKLRGLRIELGEIEAQLRRHPEVAAVTVALRRDPPGEPRLVAYVVPREGVELAPGALRAFLKERLPDSMLPAAWVSLEALPLLANGKVDRASLPAPGSELDRGGAPLRPPRDEIETRLVALWEEVLGTSPVGIGDDFFELGGHSLLAVRLLSRIEGELGLRLPVASLFERPSIEALAGLLRGEEWAPAPGGRITLQPRGEAAPLFFVHPAGGTVFCYAALARELGPARPFHAFQSPGLDGSRAPHAEIEAMAADYLEQLLRAEPAGPRYLGGWSLGGAVAYEMARQLRQRGQEVAHVALVDVATSMCGAGETAAADPLSLLAGFGRHLGVPLDRLRLDDAELDRRQSDPETLLAYVLEQAVADRALPPGLSPERARALFEVFRANTLAMARYRPRPYPGRVTVFRASRGHGEAAGADLGWGELAAEVEVHSVEGDHFSILRPPRVAALAGRLRAVLDELERRQA